MGSLLEVTQLGSGKTGIKSQAMWLQGTVPHCLSSFNMGVSPSSLGTYICYPKHYSYSVISPESFNDSLGDRKAQLRDEKTKAQREITQSYSITGTGFISRGKRKEKKCPTI